MAGRALVLINKNSTLRKYREIAFTAKPIASRPIKAPISRLPARTSSLSSLSSLQAFCLRLAGLILLLLTVWLAGLNTSSLKPASQLSSLAGLLPSVVRTTVAKSWPRRRRRGSGGGGSRRRQYGAFGRAGDLGLRNSTLTSASTGYQADQSSLNLSSQSQLVSPNNPS